MDEEILSSRINLLQEELRNFHQKISPVKDSASRTGQFLTLTYPEDNKVITSGISVLLALAKVSVCVTGPTLFPTIIYCIEGSSQLFWQATAVSGILAVLLTSMVISMLCNGVKRMRDSTNQLLNSRMLRYCREVTSSDVARRNWGKVVWPLVAVSATSLVAFLASDRNQPVLLYVSLVIVGFASGILAANVFYVLNSPANIPLFNISSNKAMMRFDSPTAQSKRSLDFSSYGGPLDSSGTKLLSYSPGMSPGTQPLSSSLRAGPQFLSSSSVEGPGTQEQSYSPGIQLLSSPRVSSDKQSMPARLSPGAKSLSSSSRVSPYQSLSSLSAVDLGTQLQSTSPGIQLLSSSPRVSPGNQLLPMSALVSPGVQILSTSSQAAHGAQLLMSSSARVSPISQSSLLSLSDAYFDCIETQPIEAFLPNTKTSGTARVENTHFLKLPFNLNFLR